MTLSQNQRVGLTVAAILLVIAVIVSGLFMDSAAANHDRVGDAGERSFCL